MNIKTEIWKKIILINWKLNHVKNPQTTIKGLTNGLLKCLFSIGVTRERKNKLNYLKCLFSLEKHSILIQRDPKPRIYSK